MSLRTYNKAYALITGDISRIVTNSFGVGIIDSTKLDEMLRRRIARLRLWIWDTFNFETMTIPDAIASETPIHVVDSPASSSAIPVPGVGYSFVETIGDKKKFEVIVNDSVPDSAFAESIRKKFKMVYIRTSEHDGIHSYYYELLTT